MFEVLCLRGPSLGSIVHPVSEVLVEQSLAITWFSALPFPPTEDVLERVEEPLRFLAVVEIVLVAPIGVEMESVVGIGNASRCLIWIPHSGRLRAVVQKYNCTVVCLQARENKFEESNKKRSLGYR